MNEELAALVDGLETFPARVRRLLDEARGADTTRRPEEGGFSLVEQLCHLRDIETEGYVERIRRIVWEDMPELVDLDGTTMAEQRHYQLQDVDAAWRDWAAARRETVRLLREHLPAHAKRTGIYGGFGVVTLEMIANGIAGHDAGHWKELSALVASALTP